MNDTEQSNGILQIADTTGLDTSLCNEDILPTPLKDRTWKVGHIASLWVGMAVCIPTYMLASQMIINGLSWKESIAMIILGNIIVAIPMVFNGHAGTKYGIPFPVLGRASFGWMGIQIPSLLRALVACGWFGIQTWLGGLAIVAIGAAVAELCGFSQPGLIENFGAQFVGFIIFWFINMFFVWRGTESIKVLETLAAPILVLVGIGMLVWGVQNAGGLEKVLDSSYEFKKPTVVLVEKDQSLMAEFNLVKDADGTPRATGFRSMFLAGKTMDSQEETTFNKQPFTPITGETRYNIAHKAQTLAIQFQGENPKKPSSIVTVDVTEATDGPQATSIRTYLFWLTAMVAFWATLALNIPDITRFARSQKDQVAGQFLGLPTTMALYSFIGVAVTCAAIVIFDDILITADAPWDPIRLLAQMKDVHPLMLILAQLAILLATLSTNIAANVISPANSFANLWPQKISFKMGGYITGVLGIVIMPWLLLEAIVGFLLTYGALLGPVLGILIADYFVVRKMTLDLPGLYKKEGPYPAFNIISIVALAAGILPVLLGMLIPSLGILYDTGWFVGFGVAFTVYAVLTLLLNKPSPATTSQ